jgi:hypothetical protein
MEKALATDEKLSEHASVFTREKEASNSFSI